MLFRSSTMRPQPGCRGPSDARLIGPASVLFLRVETGAESHWMQALPLSKTQLEWYAATTGALGNAWYLETQLLPAEGTGIPWRASPDRFGLDDYEGLFAGGLLWEDTDRLGRWLGARVPTMSWWEQAHAQLGSLAFDADRLQQLPDCQDRRILERLAQCVRPSTWAQACLMDGGMLEWVSVETWRGAAGRLIGNPRQALYPCAFNPVSRPIQPVAGTRIRAAGVRFVLTDG